MDEMLTVTTSPKVSQSAIVSIFKILFLIKQLILLGIYSKDLFRQGHKNLCTGYLS